MTPPEGYGEWLIEQKRKKYGNRRCEYGWDFCVPDAPDGLCEEHERAARQRWEKYGSSTDRDTGLAQTNFYSGSIGEANQQKKVHVAIDEYGDVIFVRDMDGTVLYDKKNGVGHLPHDLNWSRY